MIAVDWNGQELKVGNYAIYGCPDDDPLEKDLATVEILDISQDIKTYEGEHGEEWSEPVGVVNVRFSDGELVDCLGSWSKQWSDYYEDDAFEIDDLEAL